MIRPLRALLALPLLLLLCGCPPTPVTLKTVTLSPSQLDSPYEYWDTGGPCLGTFGDGDWWPAPPGQVVSGFDDVFQSFSFGCTAQEEQLYRGHVAFDLSEFAQIVDATLIYNVVSSVSPNVAPDGGGVVPDDPAVSHATVLGVSTGTKDSGNGPYYWDFGNPVSLPACTSAVFQPCSLDVSPQAKTWVAAAPFNFGFIIAGPNLDFPNDVPHDNAGMLTSYGGFQLQVLYNPALNPHAPQ